MTQIITDAPTSIGLPVMSLLFRHIMRILYTSDAEVVEVEGCANARESNILVKSLLFLCDGMFAITKGPTVS